MTLICAVIAADTPAAAEAMKVEALSAGAVPTAWRRQQNPILP